MWIYQFLLSQCIKDTKYATLYFHPWEFTDLHQKEFNFPSYVMKNTGNKMIARFEKLLQFINKKQWKTGLYKDLIPE
jgi:polysaccharide deacetylase